MTPDLDAQREAARRARHDLGRYVCFQARWLDAEAPTADWQEALAADLLATRSGPGGEEGAVSMWARLRPALPEGPERALVDVHLAAVAAQAPALAAGALTRPELLDLAGRARAVSQALSALARRLGA